MTPFRLYSAASLSGAAVVPSDRRIWTPPSGRVIANSTDGYRCRWNAPIGVISPQWPYADCDGSIEGTGPAGTAVAQSIATLPAAGLLGPDALPRFAKVADPLDASRQAFIFSRYITDNPANLRTESSFSPTLTPVPRAAFCWIAFGLLIPSAWANADLNDEVMVFQMHETPDGGDDTQVAPIGLIYLGGAGNPAAARMRMWVRGNPNGTTFASDTVESIVLNESAPLTDAWQFWVIKLRATWEPALGPYIQVWRANSYQSLQKIVEFGGPNTYNNVGRDYLKSGVYYYDNLWTGGATVKTLYHKGLYLWNDSPLMSPELLNEFLQSI